MDKNSKSKPNSDLEEGMEPIAPDMTPDSINEDVAVSESGSSSDDNLEDMSGMDAIVNEFLVESNENLDQLDQDLVDLEQNPSETGILASIFRTIHTIKGTCGFIGFSKLESVAHVGENLLSKLRDGELTINPPITSALLSMVDAIRQILSCIENSQNEGDVDYSELIGTLTSLQKGESVVTAVAASETPAAGPAKVENTEDVADSPAGEEVVKSPVSEGQIQTPAPARERSETVAAEKKDNGAGGVERKQESRGVADTNLRVDVKLLDRLMNLVGELVLARNQILQFTPNEQDSTYAATTQHLNLVTTEIQEGVMKTRMQPIGNIRNKFPRVVRDLAASCGKKIRLEMEGGNGAR